MTVRSVPGQGTSFRIRLFLPQVRHADVPLALPRGQRIGYVGVRRRIWAVDNEEADRGLLVRILEPLGFEVTPLPSGLDCLAQLRLLPRTQHPDAIFMDLAMPGLDGWDTLRTMRDEALTDAAVAIVSANAFDKALDNDVGITSEDFIVKPVRVPDLLNWLGDRLALQWVEAARPTMAELGAITPPWGAARAPPLSMTEAMPSLAALRSLEDQIHAGYVRGVHKVLDQIEAAEPHCAAFVQRHRQWARQFQLDALAHSVRACLEQAQSGPESSMTTA